MDKVKGELIWIGDVDDLGEEKIKETSEIVDFILNLSSWCDGVVAKTQSYAHISISDGKSNYEDFETASSTLWQRYNNDSDENILVNCAAGISRSVAVATTAVALRRSQSFDEALGRVRESREIKQDPHPALMDYGRKFVDKHKKATEGGSQSN